MAPSRAHLIRNGFKASTIFLVSISVLLSFPFIIYHMATFPTRQHCRICDAFDGDYFRYATLVNYSSWGLYTSTITWFAWVWRKFIRKEPSSENNENSLLFLLELSLPLSLYVMIAYTVYLGMSNWGESIADTEECFYVLTSSTPKNDPSANFYLIASTISTIVTHYILPVSNMVLYFRYYNRKVPWSPYRPIGFVILLSAVVIIVQEVGGAVIYCTNVYTNAVYAILLCTFFHFLCFSTVVTRPRAILVCAVSGKISATTENRDNNQILGPEDAAVEKEMINIDA